MKAGLEGMPSAAATHAQPAAAAAVVATAGCHAAEVGSQQGVDPAGALDNHAHPAEEKQKKPAHAEAAQHAASAPLVTSSADEDASSARPPHGSDPLSLGRPIFVFEREAAAAAEAGSRCPCSPS